jgi:hypothetical protein
MSGEIVLITPVSRRLKYAGSDGNPLREALALPLIAELKDDRNQLFRWC